MIQCEDCQYFSRDEKTGRIKMTCDPFSTIISPDCLQKLQLLRLDGLCQMYGSMLNYYNQMAPMQKKMFKFMEHEIDDQSEADSWKQSYDDNIEDEDQENY
ncbi:MAG: hypothetical protein JEZ07_12800 [Phycisphaerae bacterium]|nr:hypothetical protein [Phycisphaerae bacterium]